MSTNRASNLSETLALVSPEELVDLDASYEKQREVQSPPDGHYQARVMNVMICRTPQTNARAIRWQLEITGSTRGYIGSQVTQYMVIESEQNLAFVKPALRRLGYHGPLSHLHQFLNDFTDKRVEVDLVTRDVNGRPFQNVFFRGLVKDEAKAEAKAETPVQQS